MFGLSFLTPKVLGVIAIALVTLALIGFIYHEGGRAPRAELQTLRESIKAAAEVHAAEDAAKDAQSGALVTTLESKHADNIKAVAADWAAFHAGELQRERDRAARQGSRPATTQTRVCNDANTDRGLSDAIQEFKLAARRSLELCVGAVAAGREDVGRLLEVAGEQAVTLNLTKSYILGIEGINTLGVPPAR